MTGHTKPLGSPWCPSLNPCKAGGGSPLTTECGGPPMHYGAQDARPISGFHNLIGVNATTLGGCTLAAPALSNALAFLLARLRHLNHPCGTKVGPLGKVSLKLWTTQASNPGLQVPPLTACAVWYSVACIGPHTGCTLIKGSSAKCRNLAPA